MEDYGHTSQTATYAGILFFGLGYLCQQAERRGDKVAAWWLLRLTFIAPVTLIFIRIALGTDY